MKAFFLLLSSFGLASPAFALMKDDESPSYSPWIFQFPLPIPPIKAPSASYTGPDGKKIDFYEIEIKPFEAQIFPNLGTTTMVGYDGIAPGPTLFITKGTEIVVRFINKYDAPSSIHLHGSYSRTPFDGWADDVTEPGHYKDYYYPNAQAMRTLWYHDHAVGITAVNAYFGQAGFYILDDPEDATRQQLPSGDYDIPLMIASKQFQNNGKLFSPVDERDSLWGDVNTVNGQPWPYLDVEARKYKFRLLNAAVSRSYKLYLVSDSEPNVRLPFVVVAGDAGYLGNPTETTFLVLSMAERYEIVIDFDLYRGQTLTFKNENDFQTNDDYSDTHRVMRFVVGDTVTIPDNDIPSTLAVVNLPEPHDTIDQTFEFHRKNGMWMINDAIFSDIPNRILAFPPQGRTERWVLENESGGWSHPIHIHLVDFQVVSRTGGDDNRGVEPYEANALKDVVYLGRNERVEVVAHFAPWSGVYMFHCHNLVHEDHDMMAAFNVSHVDLGAYGYPDTVKFDDPMEQQFQQKACADSACHADLSEIESVTLPWFASLNAYPPAAEIESMLDQWYADHDAIAPRAEYVAPATTFSTVIKAPKATDIQ